MMYLGQTSKTTLDRGITHQLNQVFINLLCFWTGKQCSNKELFVLDVTILFGVLLADTLFFIPPSLCFSYPLPTLQHWFLGHTLNSEHIYSDD